MQLLFFVKSIFSSFFQAFTVFAGSLKYLKFISSCVLKIFWRKAFGTGGKMGADVSEEFYYSYEDSWLCPWLWPWLCPCPCPWLWAWPCVCPCEWSWLWWPCEHFLGATYSLCDDYECDFYWRSCAICCSKSLIF